MMSVSAFDGFLCSTDLSLKLIKERSQSDHWPNGGWQDEVFDVILARSSLKEQVTYRGKFVGWQCRAEISRDGIGEVTNIKGF